MDSKDRMVFIWDDKSTWPKAKDNFGQVFTHIRGYHGCRPLDIATYLKKGIVLPKKKNLKEQALLILENKDTSPEEIKSLFDNAWRAYYGKCIYLALCKKDLLDYCGHYLIYGSELICSIGRNLGLDMELKSKGTPTIFHVDVPIDLVDENNVNDLIEQIKDNRRYKIPPAFDFTLRIDEAIHPSLIVGSEHPHKIHDPLNYGSYYIHKEINS